MIPLHVYYYIIYFILFCSVVFFSFSFVLHHTPYSTESLDVTSQQNLGMYIILNLILLHNPFVIFPQQTSYLT